MKKIVSSILALWMILCLPLMTAASNSNGTTISIDSYTIQFSADSAFNFEEQELLAQKIIAYDNLDQETTSYNLLCTLFGHNTSVETVIVIEHCVSATQPRCLESVQDITTCSRCDYVSVDEYSSIYIVCCE